MPLLCPLVAYLLSADQPFARRWGLTGKKVPKVCEQIWYLTYYVGAVWMAYATLWDEDFMWDTTHAWKHHPFPMSASLKVYYTFQIGFYFSALFMICFLDSKRSDFFMMVFHHFATIWLVCVSYYCQYTPIGAIILIYHDIADVFVSTTKTAHYLDLEVTSIVSFTFLLLSWMVTRLFMYPCWALYSVIFESTAILGYVKWHEAFVFFLLSLQVLHVYWFYLFVKMAFNMLSTSNSVDDPRSDDEESDEEDASKKRVPAARSANGKLKRRRD